MANEIKTEVAVLGSGPGGYSAARRTGSHRMVPGMGGRPDRLRMLRLFRLVWLEGFERELLGRCRVDQDAGNAGMVAPGAIADSLSACGH